MITGNVTGQELEISYKPIFSGTVNYLTANFTFSEDWYGCAKCAHFTHEKESWDIPLDTADRITEDDHLNLCEGYWEVWVEGMHPNGKVITTGRRTIKVGQTGYVGVLPPKVPLSVEQKVQAIANEAKVIAEDANEKASLSLPNAERAEAAAGKAEAHEQASKLNADKTGSDALAVHNDRIAIDEDKVEIVTAGTQIAKDREAIAQDKLVIAEDKRVALETAETIKGLSNKVNTDTQTVQQTKADIGLIYKDVDTARNEANTSASNAKADAQQTAQDKQAVSQNKTAIDSTARTIADTAVAIEKARTEVATNQKDVAEKTQTNAKLAQEIENKAQTVRTNTQTVIEKASQVDSQSHTVAQQSKQVSNDALQVSKDKQDVITKASEVATNASNAKQSEENADKNAVASAESLAQVQGIANNLASAVRVDKFGAVVSADDVSPVTHDVACRVESRNLLPFPYEFTDGLKKGVTIKTNSDGTISLNGTATGTFSIKIFDNKAYDFGDVYLSGIPDSPSNEQTQNVYLQGVSSEIKSTPATFGKPVLIKDTVFKTLNLWIKQNAVFENIVINPMLSKENTPYVPYVPDLTRVTVSRRASNLINPKWFDGSVSQTDNMDSSWDSDGTITVKGIPSLMYPEFGNKYIAKNIFPYVNKTLYIKIDRPIPYNINMYFRGGKSDLQMSVELKSGQTYVSSVNRFKEEYETVDFILTIPQEDIGKPIDLTFKLEVGYGDKDNGLPPQPYQGQTYNVNPDGTVDGIKSLSPNMTILTDNENVNLDVSYNADTKTYIDRKIQDLAEVVVGLTAQGGR